MLVWHHRYVLAIWRLRKGPSTLAPIRPEQRSLILRQLPQNTLTVRLADVFANFVLDFWNGLLEARDPIRPNYTPIPSCNRRIFSFV
jgi:hypothetical protein